MGGSLLAQDALSAQCKARQTKRHISSQFRNITPLPLPQQICALLHPENTHAEAVQDVEIGGCTTPMGQEKRQNSRWILSLCPQIIGVHPQFLAPAMKQLSKQLKHLSVWKSWKKYTAYVIDIEEKIKSNQSHDSTFKYSWFTRIEDANPGNKSHQYAQKALLHAKVKSEP